MGLRVIYELKTKADAEIRFTSKTVEYHLFYGPRIEPCGTPVLRRFFEDGTKTLLQFKLNILIKVSERL